MEEKKNIVSKIVDWVACAMCGQLVPVDKELKSAICRSCGHLQKVATNKSKDKKDNLTK
jgi:rRNA maturation endonuclease Nob1